MLLAKEANFAPGASFAFFAQAAITHARRPNAAEPRIAHATICFSSATFSPAPGGPALRCYCRAHGALHTTCREERW